MSEVSLESLLIPEKVVNLDFPGYTDFKIDVCYLSRDELIKLRKRSVNTKFDRRTHVASDELDEKKFLVEYTKAVIKGWTGFKYRYVKEFLLVDISSLEPEDELPYNQVNAELLMANSAMFDDWLTDAVGDLENFSSNN